MVNSFTGLMTTLISVYTAHNRDWSKTAKVTATTTSIWTCITLVLFLVYNNWLLVKIKEKHDLETNISDHGEDLRQIGQNLSMTDRAAYEGDS